MRQGFMNRLKFCIILIIFLFPHLINAEIIVIGELTHEYEVKINETYFGTITVQNIGEEAQDVKIYQTDYFFYADGRIFYDEPGQLTRSNSNWITYAPERITVQPSETVDIRYTIKVPDVDLTGTYWSIFMVEGISPDSPESSGTDEIGLGIRQVFRYGIQIVTHIEGTGTRELKVIEARLLQEEGQKKLQLDIQNTGERWLRAELWSEVYDTSGNFMGRFEGGKLRMYPETSVRYTVDLSELAEGSYKALVVIDCGGDDVFGFNLNLIFEE
jgi:hypothetical protein